MSRRLPALLALLAPLALTLNCSDDKPQSSSSISTPPAPSASNSPPTSPSIGRLVYLRQEEDAGDDIFTIRADGSGERRLTNAPGEDYQPAWSPDGSRIAFVSERDGNAEIYVINAGGSAQTRLTNDLAIDSSPAWSPDGSRIAFISTRGEEPRVNSTFRSTSTPWRRTVRR